VKAALGRRLLGDELGNNLGGNGHLGDGARATPGDDAEASGGKRPQPPPAPPLVPPLGAAEGARRERDEREERSYLLSRGIGRKIECVASRRVAQLLRRGREWGGAWTGSGSLRRSGSGRGSEGVRWGGRFGSFRDAAPSRRSASREMAPRELRLTRGDHSPSSAALANRTASPHLGRPRGSDDGARVATMRVVTVRVRYRTVGAGAVLSELR
jgi:hypothetical protein